MLNRHEVHQNHTHSNIDQDESSTVLQKSDRTRKHNPSGLFLPIVLVLIVAGIGLELVGVTNVVRSFGQGGRPVITLGLWHLTDVPDGFWAKPFIDGLIQKKVISGYPNDTFRPEQAITRAEFAAMLNAAFGEPDSSPQTFKFEDVSSDFWGAQAITHTAKTGFFVGYPQGEFRPDQSLSKANALVALAKGLDLGAKNLTQAQIAQTLSVYEDVDQIPTYARADIAAATTAGLVVNEPSTARLEPNSPLTRAEATTLVYQALVYADQAEAISSPYIVNQS